MAFVIIQHLDPIHKNMTVDIFSRLTSIEVLEIKDGLRVKPNHIYIMPPNHTTKILNGVLKLLPRIKTEGLHLPIDFFFQSLANDQVNKSIGVVLSGTAHDGTEGLKAINAKGGLTVAQEPKSAKYDGMPRSAIASGIVDLILPPKEIATELIRITQDLPLIDKVLILGSSSEIPDKNDENLFYEILGLLQTICHVDFSHYKQSTLKRRIRRRMLFQKKKSFKDYFEYLQANINEAHFLFAEILINVTEFFRDAKSFDELKSQVFPAIIREKEKLAPIRIWVVGCATGEEAYSVAISLLEHMGESVFDRKIQIFATDISSTAIQHGRTGAYLASPNMTLSEERLQKYFDGSGANYRVKKSVREMCLFSCHDIIKDPPFSKLDLICCRNLLIYFDSVLQNRILSIFHFALNPSGFLWLGSSESVGQSSTLFSTLDKKNKFYCRKSSPTTMKVSFPINTYIPEKIGSIKKFSEPIENSSDIQREADRVASLVYSPPGVVINNEMEIVLIRGEMLPYLQITPGEASLNLFKMVRTEIIYDLRAAIQASKKKNTPAKKNGLMILIGKQLRRFNLNIIPLVLSHLASECYFLISFEFSSKVSELEKKSILELTKRENGGGRSKNHYQMGVEEELIKVKSYHQSLVQTFEATQEELTSANEELQSTNEELQSTNEEWETAKEELQSINEELNTLNDELQDRNMELSQLNNDLVNLISCIDIPIVIVSSDGCIRRFTSKAGKMMNLLPTDVGRPLSDFNLNVNIPDMRDFMLDVIETMTTKELDVQDREKKWFRLQARPFKTTDNRIDGAVISLIDIDILKKNFTKSKASLDYAISIANTVQIPLIVLDSHLRLESANNSFYEKFHIEPKNNQTSFLSLMADKIEPAVSLCKLLADLFISSTKLENFEIRYKSSNGELCIMLLNAQKIYWIDEGEPTALLLSILDITQSRNLQIELTEALAVADRANISKDIFLATLSHELRTPLTPILSWAQFLQTEEGSGKLKRGLEIIEQSALTQAQLIGDLLDISRIQAGKLVLNISKIDPTDIVQLAVESVRSLAEKKSITIVTHLMSLNGKVSVDPARLQQIVWNLLINAIKFSSAYEVVDIYVSTVEQQELRFASIKIIDHGKGIKSDFLPQIFKRFTQADINTTRVHGGLGIGLSIVHDLLKLLGGTVQAESEGKNKGATFTVLLPLISHTVNQKKKVKGKVTSGASFEKVTILSEELKGLTVLIVEDEQNALDIFTEILRSAGATAVPTASVTEALAAFDKYKPDILISDIALPEEDGYSLMRKVRKRELGQGRKIPAIALTAYATKEDVSRAFSAGFDAHLAKPFKTPDLFRVMVNMMKRATYAT
jgi:two-component system CheB/CheR fusion protein